MKQLAAVCLLSATLGCGDGGGADVGENVVRLDDVVQARRDRDGGGQVQPESVDALRERAEQGDAVAQRRLGDSYRTGYQGVPQDGAEAVRWYRLAAEQGDADAQYVVGIMYANGQGVPQDNAEAARWYRLAAEQGYAQAQYTVGVWYSLGEGVPQDYVQAHLWFNLAASRSTELFGWTARDRERAVQGRAAAASELTPAALNEAQRLAREWDAAHPREP